MCSLIIWMDSAEAKLFEINKDSIRAEKVRLMGPTVSKQTPDQTYRFEQFSARISHIQLLEKLRFNLQEKISVKILLIGPCEAPIQFSLFLENSAPDIFRLVVSLENVERMPDSEILSIGRRHLQKFYQSQAG